MANENAYLSNEGCYTIFTFGENRLKFISPYSLQYYKKVLKWDNGYIEVLTKYAHQDELIEEYIDLIPILKNLYMEPDEFLKHIKSVEVVNAWFEENICVLIILEIVLQSFLLFQKIKISCLNNLSFLLKV